MNVQIIKTNRKSISIIIKPDKSIIVRGPIGIKDEVLMSFVEQKKGWIEKHLATLERLEDRNLEGGNPENRNHPKDMFQNKTDVIYLGKPLNLIYEMKKESPVIQIKRQEDQLTITTATKNSGILQQALKKWYVNQAKMLLVDRVRYFQTYYIQEVVNRVTIKEQKTRWGSCSSKHNLNFNWRLILAPAEVLDYVVVHELCHLRHMDHSALFWKEVEKVLPDYKERRKWLKEHGTMIERYLG